MILKFSREYFPSTYRQPLTYIDRCMALSLSNRSRKREDEQWEWKAAALRGRLPSSPLLGEKEEGGE